jgi:hypothetical protein
VLTGPTHEPPAPIAVLMHVLQTLPWAGMFWLVLQYVPAHWV